MAAPVALVFDSGLGGLTVFREIRAGAPGARLVYLADNAVFPYGGLAPEALVARVNDVLDAAIARWRPDIVVIACNTASTLVLPHLRSRHDIPFVGTVPAVKPAAAASRSRMISVLATPGTVARDYTRELVRDYAGDCDVALVGSRHLATLAERAMAGEAVADADIAAEIAPCFRVSGDGARRTDVVALACTHYPLLLERLRALAPWPVTWVDPAPAIARRTLYLLEQAGFRPELVSAEVPPPVAAFTGASPAPPLAAWLRDQGFAACMPAPALAPAAERRWGRA
ncbi:glutamate racemase [Camelimonas abortus]|uniref:Glutamate racemase n=1 Tax=Camelimonas abortus TaxID=1017184 RepID=A0ABV7LCM7_9HYPH